MTEKASPLAPIQAITTIAASIATPLIVAFFGWRIQTEAATQGVKKDYVQMSIAILKDGTKDEQLRRWAVSVVDANSPVKFSSGLRSDLEEGRTQIAGVYRLPPAQMMVPPRPPIPLPNKKRITNGDLVLNHVENMSIAKENAIQLWYLEQLLIQYHEISLGKDAAPLKEFHYGPPDPTSAPSPDDEAARKLLDAAQSN